MMMSSSNLDIGIGEANEIWDDAAILKAFDSALKSHRYHDQKEKKKIGGSVAITTDHQSHNDVGTGRRTQAVGAGGEQGPGRGQTVKSGPAKGQEKEGDVEDQDGNGAGAEEEEEEDDDEFSEADRRFAKLLSIGAKGMAGIPGEWEEVKKAPPPAAAAASASSSYRSSTSATTSVTADVVADAASTAAAQAASDAYYATQAYYSYYPWQQQAHPTSAPPPMPRLPPPRHATGAATAQAHIPLPPPPPPPPHVPLDAYSAYGGAYDGTYDQPGYCYDHSAYHGAPSTPLPHTRFAPPPPYPPSRAWGTPPVSAAPNRALHGLADDELADLLMAWYYSGYYTGKYMAQREVAQGYAGRRGGGWYSQSPYYAPAPPPPPPPPTPASAVPASIPQGGTATPPATAHSVPVSDRDS